MSTGTESLNLPAEQLDLAVDRLGQVQSPTGRANCRDIPDFGLDVDYMAH